ncbi:DNA-directed DNA polymerase [Anaerococcus lactolyticus ATCC 51172]|uniref:DNA polymerase I n=1 Tax=Anaerococcus lactolyticus ATCC 51172 TaxID=525254 RepID=C2BCE5_9FIRM|nr:DNA polymerase I [Anaerococcus lactolyticus]EEI87347.1 DNA-directed DNA polymerase [Anaerococcus lactolyticus ATCC 51172]
MKKTVMLIDGSSLIFRAFFALPNLSNNDGVMTNGVYGFLTMYRNAFDKYKPDYVLVAFDRSSKTFRNDEYKDYKANRDKTPNELSYQFGILKDVLDSMGVKYTDLDGFEADDIVGTYARMAKEAGDEAVLITGDRDYLQLVDDNVLVYLSKKGVSDTVEYTVDKIKEEYGITPKQLIDVKGLMGDKSDNIPGVDGIGEKRALEFIRKYGSIENLYDNLDEISGKKTKESLENNEAVAYMSKKIGTIVTHAPVEFDYDDLALGEVDKEGLREKFSKLNFNKFLEELDGDGSESESKEFTYKIGGNLKDLIDSSKKTKEIFFKSVYDGENYIHSEIYSLAIKTKDTDTYIIEPEKISELKNIFEDKTINKISFDIKEEMVLLDKLDIDLIGPYDDLMLMHYLIDPSRSSYDLKLLSQSYLTYELDSDESLIGKGAKTKKYAEVDQDDLAKLLASQVNAIEDSRDKVFKNLAEYEMVDLYENIEKRLARVLASMEIIGFGTDRKILEGLKADLEKQIEAITSEIYDLAGSEFNINSTKQLGEVLFKDLDLPVVKKTKTGFSTDAKVLEKLRDKHPIIEKIERYREIYKLRSTYIEGLENAIDEDGRIRSTFRQNIASTGRLSSQEPNLQNLPIKTDEGRAIRKAFKAGEGKILIDADYSQIELRILASLADDKNMQDAFNRGIDIHTQTASEVFHTPLDEVTKLQRSEAKAVNFGIIYGISDYGLSQNLNIPRPRAKEYIDKYKKSYPQIKEYMDDVVQLARSQGYIETLFKRRRYIPEISSRNFNVRSFGERIALNTPIQGTAADIIKIAMIDTYNKLKEEGLDAKIILQIHDEIIIESSEKDKEKARDILKKCMEGAAKLKVDLLVDIGFGESMYESK